MKSIHIICLLFVVVCVLSSCNPTANLPEGGDPPTREEMLRLDPEKQKLPSYDDLSKIQKGITMYEVYSIAGNPQRRELRNIPVGGISSLAYPSDVYMYDSADGKSVGVKFSREVNDEHWRVSYIIQFD